MDEDLISIGELVEQASLGGFRFGKGDFRNTIRHYSNIGLIAHAKRKRANKGQAQTVSFYPRDTVGKLITIQKLKESGRNINEIKRIFSASVRLENLSSETQKHENLVEEKIASGEDVRQNREKRRKKILFVLLGSTLILLSGLIVISSYKGALFSNRPSQVGSVLAEQTSKKVLEFNADTVINGDLTVNGITVGSPADGFVISGGKTARVLSVTGSDVTLDQNLSATSSPRFASLQLTAANNQLLIGGNGTITWTPTAARAVTIPDATGTVVLDSTTQTLTNKSLSGSNNTFSNIANSALSNSKVTVSSGTNLTGGGDVSLGSSVTLSLKDSISLGTATFSGTLGVGGEASISAKLILDSPTPQVNAVLNRNLQLGFQNTGRVEFGSTATYLSSTDGYINSSQICVASGNCVGLGGGGWRIRKPELYCQVEQCGRNKYWKFPIV